MDAQPEVDNIKKYKAFSIFLYSYRNTCGSLEEREISSGKTSSKGEFPHVILSSPKLPEVFVYMETQEKFFSINIINIPLI